MAVVNGTEYVQFKATGILTNGRRFKATYSSVWAYITCINLYRGHIWGLGLDNKWHIIKEISA